jgi:hypothetical protein
VNLRALKFSNSECFRAIKPSNVENFRALKYSNLATGSIWICSLYFTINILINMFISGMFRKYGWMNETMLDNQKDKQICDEQLKK